MVALETVVSCDIAQNIDAAAEDAIKRNPPTLFLTACPLRFKPSNQRPEHSRISASVQEAGWVRSYTVTPSTVVEAKLWLTQLAI